ncbi:MAG: hypothetical protein QM535_15325 [Limnohabitans sp.]|nr:hypothetical protein [Limnohabitans sp.]
MISLQELQSKTTSSIELENYLSLNFEKVYDFFELRKHSDLLKSKEEFKRYVSLNWQVLKQLNNTNTTNLSFLSLLLDVCERLGLRPQFKLLYEFLFNSNYKISIRLVASELYLINVNEVDNYLTRYDEINLLLQSSYETEEDNRDKVLSTAINYYAQVLIDFGQFNLVSVHQLKGKFETTISKNEFSFLKHDIIERVLEIELEDYESAYNTIHLLLDSFLGRDIVKPQYIPNFIIESETMYSKAIEKVNPDFNSIRQVSVDRYRSIASRSIFYSLGRGVTILTEENQLFAYMISYGRMHNQKLTTSFDFLPENIFNDSIDIIDWGCGQAMASMTLFEYLNAKNIKHKTNQIILIEPSQLALKRGSLHIKKFLPSVLIDTKNKDLDSLTDDDFKNNKNNSHLHLFSNILDIDLFSLTALIDRIDNNFKGVNYFVCVSPYINDLKTERLDSFMKYFSGNEKFEKLGSVNSKTKQWIYNWTRVIRVFKATIN